VLLSFGQCEREVTSERIRDTIAASKRRELLVGGMVRLGYESREKKRTRPRMGLEQDFNYRVSASCRESKRTSILR
jgi:hypothetical protein